MPRGKKRVAGAPQEAVKRPNPKQSTKKPQVAAYSFDLVDRIKLEDALRENPIWCKPRYQDADAWATALLLPANVERILKDGQEAMQIPNDCTAPALRRWLQKWVSKLKSKDKWVLEVRAAMRNPDQVPQGKASGYLRKAAVHKEVLSQAVCQKLAKLLPKKKSSNKEDNPQLDSKDMKSFLLKETINSHKKILTLLQQNDFESKLKQLVLKETLGLQRSKMSLRELEEEEIQMQLFVNMYEPGPQESAGKGGKKRKREVVDKEVVSGLETHTDSSGIAAVVVSLTGDGGKPGLYWVRDKEVGKGEQRKLEQFQLPLEAGDAALVHRGCIHGVHYAKRVVPRITLNAFFFVKNPLE